MKIKDISKLRKHFIEKANLPDRNPDFIGYSYPEGTDEKDVTEEWGFFNVFHAASPDIENRLATVLDMAQDSQAIYEFVQNAVDCGSTKFFMFYEDDNFIAINNGDVFNYESIKAILNFAQSTKKHEKDIGKFGVGFKLIHRMVGDGNGLVSLTEDFTGPILFSWENKTQFDALLNIKTTNEFIPAGLGDHAHWDDVPAPWFFKILLTCVPVLSQAHEHMLLDTSHNANDHLFSESEFQKFHSFLKKKFEEHFEKFKKTDLNQGSIFYLKLAPIKRSALDDDFKYFSRGIEYSLDFFSALVNTISEENNGEEENKVLEKIYFQNDTLTKGSQNLEIETYEMPISSDFYHKLQGLLLQSDRGKIVKLAFGYLPENEIDLDSRRLKTAPNFFKFFPMGKEINGLHFVVHSNIFVIDTSRRELDQGNEINKLTLRFLAKKITEELEALKDTDFTKFKDIFLNLLLSDDPKIKNEKAGWIAESLYVPLLKSLQCLVPTENLTTLNRESVVIKQVAIDIKPKDFGIENDTWFYWNHHPSIKKEAEEKLGLKSWNIIDLLCIGKVEQINNWLSKNKKKLQDVLDDICKNWERRSRYANFWDKFKEIKIFQFGGIKDLKSLSELSENEKYLFSFDRISDAIKELDIIGFKISVINISNFSKSGNNNFETTLRNSTKLNRFELLFERINKYASQNSGKLSITQKNNLFKVLTADPKEFIKSTFFPKISIYTNKHEEIGILPIEGLISNIEILQNNFYLDLFGIENTHDSMIEEAIAPRSCQKETVYSKIIYEYWDKIISLPIINSDNVEMLYRSVIDFYNACHEDEKNLTTAKYIWTGKEFVTSKAVIFHSYFIDDVNLSDDEFNNLNSMLCKWLGLSIPQREILQFLEQEPLKTETFNRIDAGVIGKNTFTKGELLPLLKWNREEGVRFFENYYIVKHNNEYEILSLDNDDETYQYFTEDTAIINFLKEKEHNSFFLLPNEFSAYATEAVLTDLSLYKMLLKLINFDNVSHIAFQIFANANSTEQAEFIKKLSTVYIDTSNFPDENTFEYQFIEFACNVHEVNIELIQNKLSIQTSIDDYTIDGSTLTNDRVEMKGYDLSLSKLLLIDISDKAGAIDNTICYFLNKKLSEDRLKLIFKITDDTDVNDLREKVIEVLKAHSWICQNSHQIVYAALINCQDAKVRMRDNSDCGLFKYRHFCAEITLPYINPNTILHDCYLGLKDILRLNEENACFPIGEKGILFSPYFEGGGYVCPDIQINSDEVAKQTIFWNDIFFAYEALPNKPKQIKILNAEYDELFGFEPHTVISPDEFAVSESERLPEWIEDWIGKDVQKVEFVSKLGVHTENSPQHSIVKFRQDSANKVNELYKQSDNLDFLKNSLFWFKGSVVDRNIRQVFDNVPFDKSLPLLTASRFKTNEVVELLVAETDTDDDYYFDDRTLNYLSEIDVSLETILLILKENNRSLIPSIDAYYPSSYHHKIAECYQSIPEIEPQPDVSLATETEWKASFYTENKDNLSHSIYLVDDAIPLKWLFLGKKIKSGIENMIAIYEDAVYINNSHPLSDGAILNIVHDTKELNNDYIKLYEAKQAEILKFAKKLIEFDITEKDIDFNHVQSNKIQQSLQEAFLTSAKYSMNWYLKFLDLVLRFDDSPANSPNLREYRFEKVSIDKEIPRLIYLTETQAVVPGFIENAEIIKLSIHTPKEQKIDIKGISVKNDKVHILLRTPLAFKVDRKTFAILKTSNTIDLIRLIKNALKDLDLPNSYCMQSNLPRNIDFIFGPPGTGKTTKLAKQIIEFIKKKSRIIVLTPTNKAADVLTEKIMNICDDQDIYYSDWLIRFGYTVSNKIDEMDLLKKSTDNLGLYNKKVIITTIARFPYDFYSTINGKQENSRHYFKFENWDIMFFDEASMIAQYYAIHAIYQAYNINQNILIRIVGDPFQILPVVNMPDLPDIMDELEVMKDENIYTLVNLNAFNADLRHTIPHDFDIDFLKIQYRSLQSIGEFFSQFTYEGLLEHDRADEPEKYLKMINEKNGELQLKPINIIRFPVNSFDSIYRPERVKKSGFQPYSALLTAEFVYFLSKTLKGKWSIGIVSPYKTQAKLIDSLIVSFNLYQNNPELSVICDTVHGFQGDENDIVICLFNPSRHSISSAKHHKGKKNFLHQQNILNVAISRARDYLFILVPDNETANIDNFVLWRKMEGILQSKKLKDCHTDYSNKQIEKFIFGDERHIENNSFRTDHQLVNVYSTPIKKYYVTSNVNAVDVHIKR